MKKIYVIEECTYEGCFSVLFFSTRKKAEKVLSEIKNHNRDYSIQEYELDVPNSVRWFVWWEIGKDTPAGNPILEIEEYLPTTPKAEVRGKFVRSYGKTQFESLENARKYLKKMGHLK